MLLVVPIVAIVDGALLRLESLETERQTVDEYSGGESDH